MKKEYKGIIYKATNKVNGKVYIGQTIRTLEKRKQEHFQNSKSNTKRYYFQSAISKYGFENFEWEVIDEADNKKSLNDKEIYWIDFYRSHTMEFGYNLTLGGEFGKITGESEERRIRKSKSTNKEKNYKKVIDLKTKVIYDSTVEAAKHFGISKTAIQNCCTGVVNTTMRTKCVYYDDYLENKEYYDNYVIEYINNKASKVINLVTGEVFESMHEAGKSIDIHETNISACCRLERHRCGNNMFAYYEKYLNDEEYRKIMDEKKDELIKEMSKRILNVDTGEIFKNSKEAGEKYGVGAECIRRVCNGKVRTSCGYRWEYIYIN